MITSAVVKMESFAHSVFLLRSVNGSAPGGASVGVGIQNRNDTVIGRKLG
jgi:hypothetical protein